MIDTPSVQAAMTVIQGLNGAVAEPVPEHLRHTLTPAQWILREWSPYVIRSPEATHLQIGSSILAADLTADHDDVSHGHFRVIFENQLGHARIVPLRGGVPCGPSIDVEVIAGKFPTVDQSVSFLDSTLADLFARVSAAPFETSTMTGRGIRDAFTAPNDLFAFHFFRHRGEEVARAVQAILGSPHRVLKEQSELVRIHQVRHMDRETMHHMLQTSIQRGGGSAAPRSGIALQRLQPERVLQRLPVESHDTPENRFVLTAARRMLATLDRIERARWYRTSRIAESDRAQLKEVHQHLRQLTTDSRFTMLPSSVRIPAHSRVLQRRDGYREMTLLRDALHRTREPVFEAMEHAIDLRDIATLYEYWVLFELIDRIRAVTGVREIITRPFDALGRPSGVFEAHFPGNGTLFYQRSFSGRSVYSGITLRPDYVWEALDGRKIVLDAKFRLRYPWPAEDDGEDVQATLDGTRAKVDDITKMHAYRDAIDGVTAAIVLYPGASSSFRTTSQETRSISIEDVISDDLHGIGWITMNPMQTSETNEGPNR